MTISPSRMRARAHIRLHVRAALGAVLLVGSPLVAQPSAGTPSAAPPTSASGMPVRRIESAQAVSKEPLGAITSIRHLSDGRVMVNDGTRRRLLILDSTLTNVTVLLDSLTEVENAYGTRAGSLIAMRGDSTLFVDQATLTMLTLSPEGRITRVRSVPRAQDASAIASQGGPGGYPGIDARGRLVYRINAQPAPPAVDLPRGVPWFPSPPDSAFIVAIDLVTRKLDTLGAVRVTRTIANVRMNPGGGMNVTTSTTPLPLVDDWAVLPDGAIAFLRGRDYRLEVLGADGTLTSMEKMPFNWVQLTDEDKSRFMDSIRTQQMRSVVNNHVMNMIAWSNILAKPYPATFTVPEGFTLQAGLPRDWILPKGVTFPANYQYACDLAPDGAPSAPPAPAPSGSVPSGSSPSAPRCIQSPWRDMYGQGYTPPAPTMRTPTFFPAEQLPDYRPPFSSGAMRADGDGNLWVRLTPTAPVPGGQIFEVISREGKLIDRIQLPPGYQLAGFGAGKIVYLTTRDATGIHLARVRLR